MIVSKKVFEGRKLDLPYWTVAFAFGGGASFFILPLLERGLKSDPLGTFTFLFFVVCLPVTVLAFAVIKNNPKIFERRVLEFQDQLFADTKSLLLKEIGQTPKFADFFMHPSRDRTTMFAAAIAYDRRKLYIIEHGWLGVIDWSDVREYSKDIEGYDQLTTADKHLSTRSAVADSNRELYQDAMLKSGITLTVANIEKPKWQFVCNNPEILGKWFEILTQINEGRLDPISQ